MKRAVHQSINFHPYTVIRQHGSRPHARRCEPCKTHVDTSRIPYDARCPLTATTAHPRRLHPLQGDGASRLTSTSVSNHNVVRSLDSTVPHEYYLMSSLPISIPASATKRNFSILQDMEFTSWDIFTSLLSILARRASTI